MFFWININQSGVDRILSKWFLMNRILSTMDTFQSEYRFIFQTQFLSGSTTKMIDLV